MSDPDLPVERFARAVLSSSDDAIIAEDLDGVVLSWNPGAERLYGYTSEEMVGRSIERLIPPDHAEDLPAIMERIRQGERVEHYETERVRMDGRRIYVSVTVSPVQGEDGDIVAASTIARDITERKATDEGRHRLAAIVNSSDDAIIGKTLDGVVTSWNRGAEELYGWTAEEAVGRHISLIVPDDRMEELDHIMERIRRGQRVEPFETRRITRHGDMLSIFLTVSPVTGPDGELLGASAIGRDITRRKRAEQALREAKERAEAASRAKDRFLATVSHELRTPLNAILGYGSLLAEEIGGTLTEDQRTQVTRIQAGARHLISVIENILGYSRAQAGDETVEKKPTDLAEIVRECVELLGARAAEEGLELRAIVPEGVPAACTDAGKVRQILLNLVGNALKFTPEGGAHVELVHDPGSDAAEIRVRDTGPGLAPGELERAFEPFRQGESFPTRNHEGTGLGLAVSRHLAELIGGELTAESEVGNGSVFTLRIPLVAP